MTRDDLPAVSRVVDDTGMFPSELLAGMAEPFLVGSAPHLWLVVQEGDDLLGFAYAEPERMTDNTHNLLAIAVTHERQGAGLGKALVRAVERELAAVGGRVLLVETSSLPDFEGARAFYDGMGFDREARIRDFYSEGEDKVVFRKRLRAEEGSPRPAALDL